MSKRKAVERVESKKANAPQKPETVELPEGMVRQLAAASQQIQSVNAMIQMNVNSFLMGKGIEVKKWMPSKDGKSLLVFK